VSASRELGNHPQALGRVLRYALIGGHENQILHGRLRNQRSIKRVRVNRFESADFSDIGF
jgi:hypothetical protein